VESRIYIDEAQAITIHRLSENQVNELYKLLARWNPGCIVRHYLVYLHPTEEDK